VIDEAGVDELIQVASAALSRVWGSAVSLRLQDPIRTEWGRHTLLRCSVVEAPSAAPSSVVVKAAADPNGAIFNEWAALQFVNAIPSIAPLVPDLHAGDAESQLIVIEDLGAGPLMRRLLQAGPDLATPTLVDSQRLLGRFNAATRGQEAAFAEIRGMLPDGPPPPLFTADPASLAAAAAAWNEPADAAIAELHWAAAKLDVDESFTALTFHDACPPNRVVTRRGMRALDLEMAAFRHPMIDGAYSAIGYLRCNDCMAIPAETQALMIKAYRRALVPAYPEYETEERFVDDLAAAGAVWLIELLRRNRERAEADRVAGFFGITARQRVLAALDAFIALASITRELAGFVVWADELCSKLRSEWGTVPPLPRLATKQPGGP
jgi:hypothetical protein